MKQNNSLDIIDLYFNNGRSGYRDTVEKFRRETASTKYMRKFTWQAHYNIQKVDEEDENIYLRGRRSKICGICGVCYHDNL